MQEWKTMPNIYKKYYRKETALQQRRRNAKLGKIQEKIQSKEIE